MKDINLIDKSHLIESNTIKNTKKTKDFLETLKNVNFVINDISGINVNELDVSGFDVDKDIVEKLKKGIHPTKEEIISGKADDYIWSYGLYRNVVESEKPKWDQLVTDYGISDILKAYNSLTSSIEIVGNGKNDTFILPSGETIIDKSNIRNIIYANELSDYVIPFADQRDGGPMTKQTEYVLPMIIAFPPSEKFSAPSSDDNTCGFNVGTYKVRESVNHCSIVDFADVIVSPPGLRGFDCTSSIYLRLSLEAVGTDNNVSVMEMSLNVNVDRNGTLSVSDFSDESFWTGSCVIGIGVRPTETDGTSRLMMFFGSGFNMPFYFNIKYSFSTIFGQAIFKPIYKHRVYTAFKMHYSTYGYGETISKQSNYFVNADNIKDFENISAINGLPADDGSVSAFVKRLSSSGTMVEAKPVIIGN